MFSLRHNADDESHVRHRSRTALGFLLLGGLERRSSVRFEFL